MAKEQLSLAFSGFVCHQNWWCYYVKLSLFTFNNYSTSEALELVTMAATHANDTMKKNVSEGLNLVCRKQN